MFQIYYLTRCFGHAHIEVTKGLVAIQHYKQDYGVGPSSMDELVPIYLEAVPSDPFDGNSIKYSPKAELLYSTGSNFLDDGGAIESRFVKRCWEDPICANNPTFFIQ